MKPIIKFISLLLLASPLVSGCKKDLADDRPANNPVSQDVLDYFYFQPNSFWVFENDKTGQKDTQTVITATKKWVTWVPGKQYENAHVLLKGTFNNSLIEHNTVWLGYSKKDVDNGIPYRCWLQTATLKEGYFGTWTYPFEVGSSNLSSSSQNDSSIYTVIEKYDSLNCNGLLFFEVIKISTTKAKFLDKKDINVYWAKGAGIIKLENLTDNETWNLIDFNIVK